MRSTVLLSSILLFAISLTPARAQNSKENADFKLAVNLYNDRMYDLAAEQLRQFVSSYPNTDQGIEARYYLGLTQVKLGRYDEARMTFQTFALTHQSHPRAPDAWWSIAESYVAVENYREAALAFERVKVFHPKYSRAPDALVQAGAMFLRAGDTENARRVLRTVLQEYGASPVALSARTTLGEIYFKEGNLQLARQELQRVVDGDPSPDARAQALMVLAGINEATGRPDLAESQYREIIESYKSGTTLQEAHLRLGRLQASAGNHAEALENYKKSLAQKGNVDSALVRDAMVSAAEAHVALRQYPEAMAQGGAFASAFPRDPRTPAMVWLRARAASLGRDYRTSDDACAKLAAMEAPAQLKRRASLQPALNAEAQKNMSLAVQRYTAFLERYPDDPAVPDVIYRTATITENDLRNPRGASNLYESIAARHPGAPRADDALFAAGRCQEKLKEFDRALQIYGELVSRYPASDMLDEANARIRSITLFEVKDKDAGLEKLAMLVGDVVTNRDNAELSFRLGEIYFNDLKNYEAAAAQFTTAYTAGVTGSHAGETIFLRAKSFEYLGAKDPVYRRRAIESYTTFLQTAPEVSSPELQRKREDAALSLFFLDATTLPGALSAYANAESYIPGSARRDTMLLHIAGLQARADSTAAAIVTLSTILQDFPASSLHGEALFRRATALRKVGLADSAAADEQAYIERFPGGPRTPEVLSRLAAAAHDRKEHDRAAGYYQTLATEYSYARASTGALAGLAQAQLDAGNANEAARIFADLVEQERSNVMGSGEPDPALLLGFGRSLAATGKPVQAKAALLEAAGSAKSGPVAGQAYAALGMLARAEGSTDLAASYFRLSTQASPEAATTREVADMLFASGDNAEAARQYGALSKSAEGPADRQYFDARIILCALRAGDTAQADKLIETFDDTYDETRNDMAAFELERGFLLYRRKDYMSAIKSFQAVAGRYEGSTSAPAGMYWTGKTLESLGKPEEAPTHYIRILREYPTDPIAQRASLALGNLAFNAETWDEAIRQYRAIVDRPDPDPEILPYAMGNLINTYDMAGMYDAALALTRRYLEKYPGADDAFDKRVKIGIMYHRLGYYDQAILQFQELLAEAGSDLEGELRYYIGEAYHARGDYQQAILEFLKVPYLVTKKGKVDWTANSLYMSGQSYEKMGKHEQAVVMYQQIIDRPGIDETFKSAARKEIDRVKLVLEKGK